MKFPRKVEGKTRMDRERNKKNEMKTRAKTLAESIERTQLKCYVHVTRMCKNEYKEKFQERSMQLG